MALHFTASSAVHERECDMWAALLTNCSQLQSLNTALRHRVVYLDIRVFLYTDLPECVGETFDISFMLKQFPEYKQFTIW
jgi:hypothetical protein